MSRLSGKMLLLIELAIVLVFFCFSAAVCSYLFVKADHKTTDADMLSQAVVETTSIAETLKATDGNLSAAGSILQVRGNFDTDGSSLTLYYDKELDPCSQSDCQFKAVASKEDLDICYSYSITISDISGKEIVYELSFKAMKSGGDGNEVQ